MSAKKTGGTVGRLKAKNQAMAAMMKAQGIERHTANCPLCHKQVSLRNLYGHIGTCKT